MEITTGISAPPIGIINKTPNKNEIKIIVQNQVSICVLHKQKIKPAKNNEAQAHLCNLSTFFISPWGRGYGLAKDVYQKAEKEAKNQGFKVIKLEVRETQQRAIQIYEQAGFIKCGINPKSAFVGKKFISGIYYYKVL